MKKYVFFAPNIGQLGGAELYLKNKVQYLINDGWKVEVFPANIEKMRINEFLSFKDNYIHEFSFVPSSFSEKRLTKIINQLTKRIGTEHEKLIIESTASVMSYWAELVACKLQCRHIIFLMYEHYDGFSEETIKYFQFKHIRRELVCNKVEAFQLLFKKNIKEDEFNEHVWLPIPSSVVENINNPIVESIGKYDYTIGSIGRIHKSFVIDMIKEIKKFAEKYKDKQIQVVMIGGSADGIQEKNIEEIMKACSNVHLIITGVLFPIPKAIFKKINVFVSSAGSARVSAREGVPTISIDANLQRVVSPQIHK